MSRVVAYEPPDYEIRNEGEPAVWLVLKEEEARRLVCAIENCRMSDVFAVIKRQPWFNNIRAGVRATRHLKPTDYIELCRCPEEVSR